MVNWNLVLEHLNAELGWVIELKNKWPKNNDFLPKNCEAYLKRILADDRREVYYPIRKENEKELFTLLAQIIAATKKFILNMTMI